jgi:putative flippase GtrA
MSEPASKPHVSRGIRDRLVAALNERGLGAKALSFGLIGAINTIVDFSIFWIAAVVEGVPLIPANMLAWLIAISSSYVMNSLTTFAAESGKELTLRAYLTFVASGILGFAASSIVLVIAAMHVNLLLAKLLAIGASFTVSFSMSHFVVFRVRPRPVAPTETRSTDS